MSGDLLVADGSILGQCGALQEWLPILLYAGIT